MIWFRPLLSVLAMAWLAAGAAAADPYAFAGGERIVLRVGEWNSVARNFTSWEGLSGEFGVAPDGTILLPLAGPVAVTGKTAEMLSDEIADLLQRRIGLSQRPAVSLEIAAYKPIYVGGSVSDPGSYPFDYDMTVEQAVAVAGGLFRPAATLDQGASQRLVQMRSELDRMQGRILELETAEARLQAELAAYEGDNLSGPVTFAGADTRHGLLQMDILQANRAALLKRRASLADLEALLREQITTMTTEIGLRDRQLASAKENLQSAESLAERGLTVNSRVNDVMFTVNDFEAKRLQLELGKLTAEQQLNGALRDQASLLADARAKRLEELAAVRSELGDTRIRLAGQRDLYAQASLAAGAVIADAPAPVARYAVSRAAGGQIETLELGPTDRLKPGDTLTVEVVLKTGVSN
ncbi:polysaccharide biosynthesis/export family protein [Frigidibacter oleivorans]|uniref:polysaccharide biosynthesis/export family protein n=1 Tax=Frigidibacter oleivorans TaxID=2487129 RepID=UPI00197A871A|nr:polysaccharide biosynthesis/export family protein [Frigidibacter oleivorans]